MVDSVLALLAAVAVLSTQSAASAQEVLRIVDGRRYSEIEVPHWIDDLDGDGVDDILIETALSFGQGNGTFFVTSGASGQIIWGPYFPANPAAALYCSFSAAAVLGDFDGDGTTDIAVSCGTAGGLGNDGHVSVLSGLDGHRIVRIPNPVSPLVSSFGLDVGALGDVNGDGFADLIVSTLDSRQDVFLGPSGTFHYSVWGPDFAVQAGAGIGDITGDGRDDFVVGWFSSGLATVHSGATGAVIQQFCMPHGPFTGCAGRMGEYPVRLGDVTGDGIPDFALSNPTIGLSPTTGSGAVRVYSGADFSVVHERWGGLWGGLQFLEGLGWYMGGGKDINGDGVSDLVVTSQSFSGGVSFFTAMSGRTGQVLYRVRADILGGTFPIGYGAAGGTTLGDVDGDGYGDWAVCDSTFAAGGLRAGRMLILRGGPGDVESICDGLPHSLGHAARLDFEGPPTEGSRELWLEVERGVPDAVAHIIYGIEHAPFPHGDGILCIDPLARVNFASPFRLDASGYARVDVDWERPELASGPSAWLAGSTWVVQAIFRDPAGPAGFNTTDAKRATFNR